MILITAAYASRMPNRFLLVWLAVTTASRASILSSW